MPLPERKLRVFAVLDGPVVPAWVERILLELAGSEVAEWAGVAFVPPAVRPGRSPWFRAYARLDQRVFGAADDPLAPVDASALFERVTRAATPADARADVIVKLTGAVLPAGWLTSAPLGVWRFDHVEYEGRGGVAFFWELERQLPTTEVCLRAETQAGTRALLRGSTHTDPNSLTRGRHDLLWEAAGFVGRALREAAAAKGDVPVAEAEPASAAPPEREPGPVELARFASRTAWRIAQRRLHHLTYEECWIVALRRSRGSLVDGPLDGFVPVPMPADRWYADPFLVPDGPRLWLFYEDAGRTSGKGVIRCSEVRADGTLGESRTALECDYHLSYPFVFQRGGVWFMLPETAQNHTVELWRAEEFPWRWRLEKVLLSGMKAVDPTLLHHEGRLWLFAGIAEIGGRADDQLFAFHSDALDGEWRPHPGNPVVSDLRHARPAGPFFREGGVLYRPGQDCAQAYGAAFWIHRVDRLDEQGYAETAVRRVEPTWYPKLDATHTIQRAGGFDAIDGRLALRRRRDFRPLS